MDYNEQKIENIVECLRHAKDREKKCSLLIGAGCSVKAGIPTAAGFVEEIKKRLLCIKSSSFIRFLSSVAFCCYSSFKDMIIFQLTGIADRLRGALEAAPAERGQIPDDALDDENLFKQPNDIGNPVL